MVFKLIALNNSKLIGLLKKLDKNQYKALKSFVESPFHNEQKAVTDLCAYILNNAHKMDSGRLIKQVAWKHLFAKKPYNDVRMRRIMSDLFKVCRDYISWYQMTKNAKDKALYELQFYRENQLDKHFDNHLKNIRKQKSKNQEQNLHYFYNEFQIEQEVSFNLDQRHNRNIEPNLQILSDKLDAFYLCNKLKCCCLIVNYQNLSKRDYTLPLIEEILEHLKNHDYNAVPMIAFYHNVLLSLLDFDNYDHFEKMKKILLQNAVLFESDELKDMFIFSRNYIIKKANQNKGDVKYLNELFDLYKMEMDSESFLEKNIISPFTYKNIVTLGIRLEQFDWTEQFIEQYQNHLSIEFKESVYAFNLSRLYFSQRAFEKVIQSLLQVEYHELFLELDAKVLLLKTYYELDETETLISFLDSFKIFLRRKQSLNYHQKSYLALIKAVKQLVKLKVASKEKREEFKTEITKINELVDQSWVLEKVGEL